MVDLVEDDQGLRALGADPHRERVDRDTGVGDRDPDVVVGGAALARGVGGVDRDARTRGGLGPLGLQVLGRGDDDDAVDDAAPEEVGGDGQREGRLAGTGGRDGEEVTRLARGVEVHRRLLPGTQRGRGAPGGPVGPRGGQRRVGAPRHASGPEPSEPEPSPDFMDSQTSLQSGHTGNFSGAREGTHTLPHSAITGVPMTIASVSLSLGT